MEAKVLKRVIWAGGAAVLLLLFAGGVWGYQYVRKLVGYEHASWYAGCAYGYFHSREHRWPKDLPEALAYARENADERMENWASGARHPDVKAYLDGLDVRPGFENEHVPDLEYWAFQKATNGFSSRFDSAVLRKDSSSTSDAIRERYSQSFYTGVIAGSLNKGRKWNGSNWED